MLKKYDPPKNWKIMGVLLLKRFQIMTHCREKCTFSASLCVVHCLLLVYISCNVGNDCLNDLTTKAWFTSFRGVYQPGHLDHFWRIVKQFIYYEIVALDISDHDQTLVCSFALPFAKSWLLLCSLHLHCQCHLQQEDCSKCKQS